MEIMALPRMWGDARRGHLVVTDHEVKVFLCLPPEAEDIEVLPPAREIAREEGSGYIKVVAGLDLPRREPRVEIRWCLGDTTYMREVIPGATWTVLTISDRF